MAAPRRIIIPSLSDIMQDDDVEKEKGSLFKRHKSSRDIGDVEGSTKDSDVRGGCSSNMSNSSTTTSLSSVNKSSADSIPGHMSKDASSTISNGKNPPNSNETSDNLKSSIPPKPGSSNSLIVNPRQRGNPILKCVRNIPWEYGNIVADYVMGPSNCALFLSLRYHQLHPNYIHDRLKNLGKSYDLRVMLVQVDVKEPHHLLKDLAKICLLADCTLILAFSTEEAGRYLETYKVFENKPAEAIMEKTEDNFMAKFVDCLTRVKSVNKTDCATLLTAYGSLSSVMEAKEDELCLCPGFGPQKAKRLHNIFQEPFLRNLSKAQETQDRDFDAEGT